MLTGFGLCLVLALVGTPLALFGVLEAWAWVERRTLSRLVRSLPPNPPATLDSLTAALKTLYSRDEVVSALGKRHPIFFEPTRKLPKYDPPTSLHLPLGWHGLCLADRAVRPGRPAARHDGLVRARAGTEIIVLTVSGLCLY